MINNFFTEEDEYHCQDSIYTHPDSGHCLYLGDMSSAVQLQGLTRCNIRTVITAAAGMDHIGYPPSSLIKHVVYPIYDIKSQNIGKLFNPVHQLIQSSLEKGSVLVHCAAGISRSATLIIAYLMRHKMWGFREAIAFVRQARPKACPNLGFQRQLKEYELLIKKPQRNFQRRAPRTSEEQKHTGAGHKNRNIELPEIGSLGKTQVRSIVLNPFSENIGTRSNHRNRRPELDSRQEDDLPHRLRPIKLVRKTKSMIERQEIKTERVLPVGNVAMGVQSVFLKKIDIGQSHHTDALIRRRPPLRFQHRNNPL